MKVSHEKSLANDLGLRRRCDSGNNVVLSVRLEGNVGQLLSSEITTFVCRSYPSKEKAAPLSPLFGEVIDGHGGVLEPVYAWTFQTREPGDPMGFHTAWWNITAVWNGHRTSQRVRLA